MSMSPAASPTVPTVLCCFYSSQFSVALYYRMPCRSYSFSVSPSILEVLLPPRKEKLHSPHGFCKMYLCHECFSVDFNIFVLPPSPQLVNYWCFHGQALQSSDSLQKFFFVLKDAVKTACTASPPGAWWGSFTPPKTCEI